MVNDLWVPKIIVNKRKIGKNVTKVLQSSGRCCEGINNDQKESYEKKFVIGKLFKENGRNPKIFCGLWRSLLFRCSGISHMSFVVFNINFVYYPIVFVDVCDRWLIIKKGVNIFNLYTNNIVGKTIVMAVSL